MSVGGVSGGQGAAPVGMSCHHGAVVNAIFLWPPFNPQVRVSEAVGQARRAIMVNARCVRAGKNRQIAEANFNTAVDPLMRGIPARLAAEWIDSMKSVGLSENSNPRTWS